MAHELGEYRAQLFWLDLLWPKERRECPQVLVPLFARLSWVVLELGFKQVVNVSANTRQALFQRRDILVAVKVFGVVFERLELLFARAHELLALQLVHTRIAIIRL